MHPNVTIALALVLTSSALATPCMAQGADPAVAEAGRSYMACLTTHIRRIDRAATEDEALDTAKAACSPTREYAADLIARTYLAGRIGVQEATVAGYAINTGYPDVARSIHEYKRRAKP